MLKLGVFIAVVIAHIFALQTYIKKKEPLSKPKDKIYHIKLSSVVVKKPTPPKPKVEPIILPPDPEPLVEKPEPIILPPDPEPVIKKPEPIILPPDPKPIVKPKRVKKQIKKRKRKPKKRTKSKQKPKPIVKHKPIVQEIVQEFVEREVIEPVIQQEPIVKQKIDTSSLKDAYTDQIRREINSHLFYPRMAKRLRIHGEVEVAFRVLKDGTITNIEILNTPKQLLAKGAIKTLKMLNLQPIPSALGESFLDITIPIEFRLIRR